MIDKEKLSGAVQSHGFQEIALSVLGIIAVVILCVYAIVTAPGCTETGSKPTSKTDESQVGSYSYPYNTGSVPALITYSADCATIPDIDINSECAVLADAYTGEIIASRQSQKKIYPASLTKIMTMIVAVENIKEESNLSDKIQISQEVFDAMKAEGSSGLLQSASCVGDVFTVKDLLYIMMLNSDGVAATELAIYTAGSESAFVEMMNRKATDMGLTGTHFANCTGLHDENNYSTCQDLASILVYAVKNDLCRTLMSTKEYNAVVPYQGKEITYYSKHTLLADYMPKSSPNQPSTAGLSVVGGKTGYIGKESGACLGTFAYDEANRKYYVCITVNAEKYANCITDYITIYDGYIK